MTTNRILPDAGWTDLKALPKGPNGRALCRRCNQEVPAGRRSFCSDDCVHEWKVRSQPQYARECVEARDKGVCAICGLDTERFKRENKRAFFEFREGSTAYRYSQWEAWYSDIAGWMSRSTGRAGWPKGADLTSTLWQMDHTLPVVEGGGACGLDNLRTLCLPCHRTVTKELRGRLAKSKQKAG